MSQSSLEQLNSRFVANGAVRFEAGAGGLTRAVVRAAGGEAHVYLHGAHVTHFQPANQRPVLFVSERSMFAADKPIRGGVPICFPWFGAGGTPMHGFARLMDWTVESAQANADGSVSLTLALHSSDKTHALWPHDFIARFTARIGRELEMTLAVTNSSSAPFRFEEALHSYFAVADVRNIAIRGLEGATYLDKTDNLKPKHLGKEPLRFAGETDSMLLNTTASCTIDDPGNHRRIRIAKDGSNATVVWNPWIDKARVMADFGDEEWPRMVCVETCNVGDNAVTLDAGKTHTMRATLSVEP